MKKTEINREQPREVMFKEDSVKVQEKVEDLNKNLNEIKELDSSAKKFSENINKMREIYNKAKSKEK